MEISKELLTPKNIVFLNQLICSILREKSEFENDDDARAFYNVACTFMANIKMLEYENCIKNKQAEVQSM